MDKRPRRADGTLYSSCVECGIEPNRCKGFCIFQRLEKETEKEQEENYAENKYISGYGR